MAQAARLSFGSFKIPAPTFPYGKCKVCEEALTSEGDCPSCEESATNAKITVERAVQAMGSVQAWEDFTLKSFKRTKYNAAALDFMQKFDANKHNAYLCGMPGAGKSHLAAIAKRPLVLAGKIVVTVSMDDVFQRIREHISTARIQREEVEMLTRAQVLNIEDLGVEKETAFAINLIYQVIEKRCLAKRNGLIITSNQTPTALACSHGNMRVASRIVGLCGKGKWVFDLTGEKDWRMG